MLYEWLLIVSWVVGVIAFAAQAAVIRPSVVKDDNGLVLVLFLCAIWPILLVGTLGALFFDTVLGSVKILMSAIAGESNDAD
jgi:nitrate reductase NapE component